MVSIQGQMMKIRRFHKDQINMMNRLYNCKNPYQGTAKKVLCLCSAGLLRSPTAAIVLQKEFGYNTRAAGVDKGHALIPVDDVLLNWADEIVVMNEYMMQLIPEGMTAIVLDIPDSFSYMDENLQKLILERYKEAND